jgi:predicted O-linked N-acetylglucosamine transferase (SPINDLY family)
MSMRAAGRTDDAIATVRVHLRLKPRDAEALGLMGVLLQGAGRHEESERSLMRAIELDGRNPVHMNNLGVTLHYAGREQEAVAWWERAIEAAPAYPLPWIGLATGYARAGQSARAVEAGRRAVQLAPDSPAAHANLAFALQQAGRTEEACEAAASAVAASPGEPRIRSSQLMLLNYVDAPPERAFAAHRAFGAACPPARARAEADADPSRPLTVGFLSADLKDHSVAFFVEAILRGRDRAGRAIAFSAAPPRAADPVQDRLRALFDEWVDAWSFGDAALDAAIRDRKVDVLVDLMGHSAGNRLTALASGPAPVIVSAIGYPNTTGLPAVGWRVVDSVTDPPGAERWCTERLLRLDPCFLCYRPPDDAPGPAMPPDGRPITFGSFNNSAKISARTARLWAAAMEACPGSRLLLKSMTLADDEVRRSVVRRLADAGIDPGQVELVGLTAGRAEHLALYSRVHVALDTVPYNGTTTTCEALWMGVPTVTLSGDRHAARVSESLLRAAGHPEWVAPDEASFAELAARLATDRTRLSTLRAGLRDELRGSALLDGAAYGRRFMDGLREAWQAG